MGWWSTAKGYVQKNLSGSPDLNPASTVKGWATGDPNAPNQADVDAASKQYQDYYSATEANEAAAKKGIDAQLAAAQQEMTWAGDNVTAVGKQQQDIAKAARRRMAAGLAGAGSRFAAGSGAELAQRTQQGADVGAAEADLRSKASMAMQQAAQRALEAQTGYAQAQSAAAAEQQKLLDAALARKEADATLLSEADAAVKDIAGYVASESDMQEAANKLERDYLPKARSPQTRAAMQQKIAQLRNGTYSVKGSLQSSDVLGF